ncbi:MAG: hypothetical protein Q9157_009093 [Trypethelium eluteriae]
MMQRSKRHVQISTSTELSDESVQLGIESSAATIQDDDHKSDVSILDILDIAASGDIPQTDLKTIGTPVESFPEGGKVTYALGTGYTASVVRHSVDQDIPGMISNGSVVALKIFNQNTALDPNPHEGSAMNETY